MEGAALRDSRQYDLLIAQSWHTAIFVLKGYAGELKGKSLSDFLSSERKQRPANTSAQAISFFHALKAKGLPIEITRTPRKVRKPVE